MAFVGLRLVKRVLTVAGRAAVWPAEQTLSDAANARRRREAEAHEAGAKVGALWLAARSTR